MIAPKLFEINGSTVFTSDVPIKGIDYVDIYTSASGLIDTYTKLNKSEYQVINDAVVFSTVPSGNYLRMVVVTSREESTNTPNSLSTVFAYLKEIKLVADNIDKLFEVYNASSLITPEYKNASFTAQSQKSYLVDSSIANIDISIDDTVTSFTIRDFNTSFLVHTVTVYIGQTPYVLTGTNKMYQFVRYLNTFRVYDHSCTLIDTVMIA